MDSLKIKVCGMTDVSNVKDICSLAPDFIGYIFYPKSVRYVGDSPNRELFSIVPDEIIKTAVFVNEYYEKMIEVIVKYNIEAVQLHGMETPETCSKLKSRGITVIKAIPGDQLENKKLITSYSKVVDYFLFDTPVSSYGGSGRKFDWSKLAALNVQTPFFLSGGISVGDSEMIKDLKLDNLYAVDVNSRFELSAGIKDVEMLKVFIKDMRNG